MELAELLTHFALQRLAAQASYLRPLLVNQSRRDTTHREFRCRPRARLGRSDCYFADLCEGTAGSLATSEAAELQPA